MIDDIVVSRKILEGFVPLIQKNLLGHAYLFVGPACGGKTETACALAKLINCEKAQETPLGDSCNTCPSCLKINKGIHPDVHVLDHPEGEAIKIEPIRELLLQVFLRPFEAVKKVFIIRNIEDLTPEAGNALLKTLEEPTASSLLLLTTASLEKVLGTIVSRCQLVRFSSLSAGQLKEQLKKCYDQEDPSHLHFLSFFTEGSLGKARKLQEENIFEKKNKMIDQFILSAESENFLKEISGNFSQTKLLLDILLSWMRDCLLLNVKVEDRRMTHYDRLKELKNFQERFTFEQLKDMYEQIVETKKMLDENLNIKIPLLILKETIWTK